MCEICGGPLRHGKYTCSPECRAKRASITLKGRTLNTGRTHIKKGTRPKNYKGFWISEKGYVIEYNPTHPMANHKGYVRQHRRIMSDILGRPLEPYEDVHHKNHIRDDNRPENLELLDHGEHSQLHIPDRVRARYA